MKLFISVLCFAALFTFDARLATSQDSVKRDVQALKHIQTTLPDNGYSVRFAAQSINRDLSDSVVYLRGNVQVEMSSIAKPTTHQVMVPTADRVEFHEQTGEILPFGNVKLTVREQK